MKSYGRCKCGNGAHLQHPFMIRAKICNTCFNELDKKLARPKPFREVDTLEIQGDITGNKKIDALIIETHRTDLSFSERLDIVMKHI
jgi:hypothetical protein